MFLIIYIAIGLLLGPSSLNLPTNDVVFNFCAQGFLFVAGAELSLRSLKMNLPHAFRIAGGAFLLPFAVGLMAGPWVTSNSASGVIIAIALSISALPVIVQILKDLKIYDSRTGHIVVAAATLCDILAWAIFLLVIPAENRQTWAKSHFSIFFFFLGLALSGVLHRYPRGISSLLKLSRWIFAPLFFVGVGMKIHLQDNFDPAQFFSILGLAIFSKVAGVYAVARWNRFSKSESTLMAIVLNARGAMEILYATLALSLGMIDRTLFTSLVLMAVVSSVMAAPFSRRWKPIEHL